MANLQVLQARNPGPVSLLATPAPGVYTKLVEITSGNFTPGDTYLIIAKCTSIGMAVNNNFHLRFNGVDDPRFELNYENGSTSPSGRSMVFCMGAWTAVAGHDVAWWAQDYTTPGSSGQSAQKDDIVLTAINLSQGEMEDNFWLNENSTLMSSMDDTPANNVGASVTFTPDGTSNYLVLGAGHSDPQNSTDHTKIFRMELYDSVSGVLSDTGKGPEAGSDDQAYGHAAMWVLEAPAASSRTVSLRFRGASIWDHRFSSLLILKLDAFHGYVYGLDTTLEVIGASETTYLSETFTPVSGEALQFCLFSTHYFGHTDGSTVRAYYNGTQVEASEHTTGSQAGFVWQHGNDFTSRKLTGLSGSALSQLRALRSGSTSRWVGDKCMVMIDLGMDNPPVKFDIEPIDAQSSASGTLSLDNYRIQHVQTKTARVSPLVTLTEEQSASARSSSPHTSLEVTLGAAPQVGNLIVVAGKKNGTGGIASVSDVQLGGVTSFTRIQRGAKFNGVQDMELQIWAGIKTVSDPDDTVDITFDATSNWCVFCVAELSILGGDFTMTPSGAGFSWAQTQGTFWHNGANMFLGDDLRTVSLALGCCDYPTTVDPPKDVSGNPSDWEELEVSAASGTTAIWSHIGGRYMDTANNSFSNNELGAERVKAKFNSGLDGYTLAHALAVTGIPDTTVDIVLDSVPALNSLIVVTVDITKSVYPATPITSMTMGGVSSFTMISAKEANEDAVGQVQLWYGVKTGASADDTVAIVCGDAYDQVTAVVTEFTAKAGEIIGLDGAVGTAGSDSWPEPHWADGAALTPTKDRVLCLMAAVACHARPTGESGGTRPSDTFEDPTWEDAAGLTPSEWQKAGQEVGYWAGKGHPSSTDRRTRGLGLWWHVGGVSSGDERCYIYWGNETASGAGDVKSVGIPVLLETDANANFDIEEINAQSSVAPLEFSPPFVLGPITVQSSMSLEFFPPLGIEPVTVQSSLLPVSLLSLPFVVNRAPASGTVGGVSESVRFSVRDKDREVDRSTFQLYLGYGSAWWGGGVLPENDERTEFTIRSWVGAPSNPALRSLDGDDLLLEKTVVGLQESMYEFGGLQSPVAYDAPLMFEFKVTVDDADVVFDALGWSGVFAGIKAYNKGVAIKLADDGGKVIQLHSAEPTTSTPLYSAPYDWDQGTSHTFKLLWLPQSNVVKLYVSLGADAFEDKLLITGAISAFPDLPSGELPAVQPIGFFGHGSSNATSKSRWSSVHLYQTVTQPIVDGVHRGGHTGNFFSDEMTLYDASALPRDAVRPWIILPDSFGAIGGEEFLEADGRLVLRRSSFSKSIGFYRVEPKVEFGPTIVDFRLWGTLATRPPGPSPESGIEVYVDDGVKRAVVEFLDTGDIKSVGLQGAGSGNTGWNGPSTYRFVVDPEGDVRILTLTEVNDGLLESEFVGTPYSSLPASALPGPGIGFLHNANTVQATAEMSLSWLRYSLDTQMWEASSGLPTSPWVLFGTGTPTVADDIVTIVDDNDGGGPNDDLGYGAVEVISERGMFVEAVCIVDSYTIDGVSDLARAVTGVAFSVDDGGRQYRLMFADGGPELGKIAFLATDLDFEQNLIDIRARRPDVAGTYFSVDWSKFHHYRIERTIGGYVQVYLDWSTAPEIQLETQEFAALATIDPGIRFGSVMPDRKSTSRWQSVRYGISKGWDVETLPKGDELRYDHAINSIAEVDS